MLDFLIEANKNLAFKHELDNAHIADIASAVTGLLDAIINNDIGRREYMENIVIDYFDIQILDKAESMLFLSREHKKAETRFARDIADKNKKIDILRKELADAKELNQKIHDVNAELLKELFRLEDRLDTIGIIAKS